MINGFRRFIIVCLISLSSFIGTLTSYAQAQSSLDSLKQVYNSNKNSKTSLHILAHIGQNETDPDEKLHYSDLLIKTVKAINNDSTSYYLSAGYLQRGNALQLKGEFHDAIEAYFICMDWAKKDKDEELSASLMVSIADTYSMIGNSESAEKYYDEAILLLRKVDDPLALASALLNAGDEYYRTGQYDKALSNFAESGDLFEQLDFQIGKAYNIGNIGMVYAKQGKHDLAKTNMNQAITLLEDNEDFYAISEFLNFMSDLYSEQNNHELAVEYAEHSLDVASEYKLKDQISDANLQLSRLLENAGKSQEALERYKEHIAYRDSIINLETVQKIASSDLARKDTEVALLKQKRKNQRIVFWSTVGVSLLIVAFAFSLFKQIKFVKKANKAIAFEKHRSDTLLLNILPEDTAQELKDNGSVVAKKYPAVTVLFSDFKGFTRYAENLSPEQVVETVDHYFSKFDAIMEEHGLEKIKTIGDAYMAVGGLSFDNTVNQAKEMVLAAKAMNDFVNQTKHNDATTAAFDIRIGINTGPVVAGVVGTKKFAYDIWGDAVNIASRMESNSEPGRINISDHTHQIIKDDFDCEYRGEISVKNRGQMKMYFVNG